MDAGHIPVLLHECIENLNIRPDGIYVDGTLGMGGHSEQIAGRLTTGTLIGIDRDETAIARARRAAGPVWGPCAARARQLSRHGRHS